MSTPEPIPTCDVPCRLVFRATPPGRAVADRDEICLVRATAEDRPRRDLARLALEKGPQAFLRGEGPIRRIVVPVDPTLDHLLAAEFLQRLLAGRTLPAGADAMAECAQLIREGLRPGKVALERSPEAVFLAILNGAGEDLTEEATAEKFRQDWARMALRIMKAAEEGIDPFVTSLFDGPEFAREQAFLARDCEVFHLDVARGQRWRVGLPGGPPVASGLLLRQPKSLLFKHWARSDAAAPASGVCLFLAVQWDQRKWVFSTDPVQRISLQSLAGQLQAAETAANPSQADKDPWFDGKTFAYTLVASPHRGTALAEEQVLEIVKRWVHARPATAGRRRTPLLAGAVVAVLLTLATWIGSSFFPASTAPASRRDRPLRSTPSFGMPKPNLYVLTIGVSQYNESATGYPPLSCAIDDARDLADEFRQADHRVFGKVKVAEPLIDKTATKNNILVGIRQLRDQCTQDDIAVITFAGHGDIDENTGNQFFFVPYDFDQTKEPCIVGLTRNELSNYLKEFPCTVVVILDTCHSGNGIASDNLRGGESLEREIATTMRNLRQAGKAGVVVLAACVGSGSSREKSGHGVLTQAVLEVLRGTPDPAIPMPGRPSGLLTFEDVNYYATRRVPQLADHKQSVVAQNTGVGLGDVPLGVVRGRGDKAPADSPGRSAGENH
jgi:hypothetical protein